MSPTQAGSPERSTGLEAGLRDFQPFLMGQTDGPLGLLVLLAQVTSSQKAGQQWHCRGPSPGAGQQQAALPGTLLPRRAGALLPARSRETWTTTPCPLPGPPAVQGTSSSLAGQRAGAQAEGGLGGGQQLLQPPSPPQIRARAKGCCWHSCCRGAREHPGPHLPHQGPRVKPKGQGGADRWGRQRDVSPGLPLPLAPTQPCGSICLLPLSGMGRRGSRSAEGDGGRWAGIPCTKRGNRGAVNEGESARWLPLLVGWKGEGRGCTVPSPSRGSP